MSGSFTAIAETVQQAVLLREDGVRFGTSTTRLFDDGDLHTEINTLEFDIDETDANRQTVRQVTTRTDEAGRPVSLEQTTKQGRAESRLKLVLTSSEQALLYRWSDGDLISTTTVTFPADTHFGDGDGQLADWLASGDAELEFPAFSFSAGESVSVRYIRSAVAGEVILVQKVIMQNGAMRAASELEFDPTGKLLRQRQPMLGSQIEIVPTNDINQWQRTGALSAIRSNQIKSLHRISDTDMRGQIRYTFRVDPDLSVQVPETPEQKVRYAEDLIIIDVCASCTRRDISGNPDYQDGLSADLWIESDSPVLRAFVANTAQLSVSDTEKMKRLMKKVRRHMKDPDFTGHYSALEAFRNRKGDCMEDALLLAALGRAAGIPTKVASGLVYSREKYHGRSNIFMPHAWTLAYVDGEWRSFDVSLDDFDATHIAFTVGDGSQLQLSAGNQIAGMLSWEMMQGVQKRPE